LGTEGLSLFFIILLHESHIFLVCALKISIGISNATIDMFLADMTLE